MLILSRKPGQSVVLGRDITLTLVAVKGNRIRIGIAAPDGCRIRRAELERTERTEGPQPQRGDRS
jgi:carbon storage regulator